MAVSDSLIRSARSLSREMPSEPVCQAVYRQYNPLEYAWAAHRAFIKKFASEEVEALFLGMNPGPWGMVQTGVPFGEVAAVRDWMGIKATIKKPDPEHPKRPVLGLDSPRSEVSGRRLWGLFQERFETPEAFFKTHFVVNHCPLVFMAESGRNITPDQLPKDVMQPILERCDEHLRSVVRRLKPRVVVGIGAYAARRAKSCLPEETRVVQILHPSPASPAANRDWAGTALKQLQDSGVWA